MNIQRNTLVDVTNADIIDGHFIVPEGIERIGNWAFMNCTSLKSIQLPSGLKKIGNWSFSDCKSLESIRFPSGLREIGDGAFDDCSSLKSVSLPSDLQEIGDWAFDGCINLNEVICENEELRETVRFQALIGRPVFSPEQFKKLSQMATKNE